MMFSFLILLILPMISISQQVDLNLFKNMKPRSVGPAGMSGRVTAIDVNLKNNEIIYVGTASGGLWKSETGGLTWQSVFDKEKVASIGALKVDKQNPDIVWAGTGEGNPRNSQTMGAGIYKSIDGGNTWQLMGLEKTYTIHRIEIHPTNSDIVYVAALGSAWGDNAERGVYKTTDGGKTWEKVLFVNSRTGCADMVLDPQNPNKIYAAMWEYHRDPWFFTSGGAGSGLYITLDAGKTWKKRTDADGLPKGELGRIGLAVSPANPKRVYALIEAKENGMYRSDDGGFKWQKTASNNIGDRPFYYAELYADPKDENRLYNIFTTVTVSIDGAKTFEQLVGWAVHPDHHAFWVNPLNPNNLIDGNDGGLSISYDRGKTWRFVGNLPVAQYYHINVDNQLPYNIYGGMQDNGSWVGPAYSWISGGIRNSDWQELYFGDGFDVVPDASNPRYCYAMSQGGNVAHIDMQTGYTKPIQPVHPDGVALRFNWNSAIAHSPHSKTTIYFGSQFLHKSNDNGTNWEIISPDLTTNNKERQKQSQSGGLTLDATNAENYTTIISIAPSPVNENVIWVGTDDGNLQLTTDGGKNWKNMISSMIGAPKDSWITQIRASKYAEGEAFVVIDNHRLNDWTPYLFHTKDFGKTWTRLANENNVWGFALSVIQDPVEPKLLFLGTEFGLYVSIDYGKTWNQWKNSYPTVSTIDLAIQEREHDLVIGTFGRSAFVLDDIRPLRELAQNGTSLLSKDIHLFDPPDAYMANFGRSSGERFSAHTMYEGENRNYGAMISFYTHIPKTVAMPTTETDSKKNKKGNEKTTVDKNDVKKEDKPEKTDSVKLCVYSTDNKLLRTIEMIPDTGLNRMFWYFDTEGIRMPGQQSSRRRNRGTGGGFPVLPGTYKLKISYKNSSDSAMLTIHPDPRMEYNVAEANERQEALADFMKKIETLSTEMEKLSKAKETTDLVLKLIPNAKDSTYKPLKDAAKAVQDSIMAINETYSSQKEEKGITDNSHTLRSKLMSAYYNVGYDIGLLTGTQKTILKQSSVLLDNYLKRIASFFENDWKKFKEMADTMKLTPFKE